MDNSTPLQAQAEKLGLGLSYYDLDGNLHYTSDETLAYFTEYLNRQGSTDKYPQFDDVIACFENEPIDYDLTALFPDNLPTRYQFFDENRQLLSKAPISSSHLTLPPQPFGYYQLELQQGKKTAIVRLLVSPRQIYQPPVLAEKKAWGLNVQLYSLRSGQNWGIGDFGDLAFLIKSAVRFGADFIGINPLHQMFAADPEWTSPYSSSSRRWLNVIYLNIPALPEFKRCKSVQDWVNQQEIQLKIAVLRHSDQVNYTEVTALKYSVLERLFDYFKRAKYKDIVERRQAFAEYVALHGENLREFALFETLDQLADRPRTQVGWQGWKQEWQQLSGKQRQALMKTHAAKIEFYSWLQWLAETQLADLQTLCKNEGMALGIYGDLAVNSGKGSADVWCDPELFCIDANIGAPPDPLGPVGQNWGLPPYNPKALKACGFQPFIDLFRANMQYFGVLRIDHVMGLFRLWLIPQGKTAVDGVYLHYPFDELMAVLAIESRRNQCLIVGEDLGTVPDEVRSKLNEFSVFSYFVLYFERKGDHYPQAAQFPLHAFATVGTHDVSSLAGFWHCRDLELFGQLGILNGEALGEKYRQRVEDKQALLNTLRRDNYLPWDYHGDALSMAMHPNLALQIHRYLAHSRTQLAGVQIENLTGQEISFNLPGTSSTEYPNWCKKLDWTLEQFFNDEHMQYMLNQINHARQA